MKFAVALFLTTLICYCSASSEEKAATYARARIESCPGCSLNRLPDVKKFVYVDIPMYEDVEFKKIQGAPPELVLLNESDEEVERHTLSSLNRKECNELLQTKGFKLKPNVKLEL